MVSMILSVLGALRSTLGTHADLALHTPCSAGTAPVSAPGDQTAHPPGIVARNSITIARFLVWRVGFWSHTGTSVSPCESRPGNVVKTTTGKFMLADVNSPVGRVQ